jgi:hypothetical protein
MRDLDNFPRTIYDQRISATSIYFHGKNSRFLKATGDTDRDALSQGSLVRVRQFKAEGMI